MSFSGGPRKSICFQNKALRIVIFEPRCNYEDDNDIVYLLDSHFFLEMILKKRVFIQSLFICFLILLISCNNNTKKSEQGFFYSFEDCKKVAQKKNKDFLVIFTSDDENSVEFNKNVIESDDFSSVILNSFEVVHYDFSKSTFNNAQIKPSSSKQEKKTAKNIQKILNEGNCIVGKVRCQITPSIYRFSKNGFLISEVILEKFEYSSQKLLEKLSFSDSYSKEISKEYEEIKKLSGIQKVQKIDEFYSTFSMEQTLFANDLIDDVLSSDKNNETGLLSKYLFQSIQIKTANLFVEKRFKEISDEYVKLLENSIFTPAEKINLYFSAGFYLSLTENPDEIPRIIEYLEMALSLDEKSLYKDDINYLLNFYKDLINKNK